MIVLGAISGTSIDGIDVAAARFSGAGTPTLHLETLGARTVPWSPRVRAELLDVLPPAPTTVAQVCRLDVLVGREIAAAIGGLQRDLPGGHADLAVSHGQTLYHWVEGGIAHGGMQIGGPAHIVEETGLPVVSDLRSADIAAGGQGAPLAGMLDALVLRGAEGQVGQAAALNLGGIANVTIVRPDEVIAFDTGPANCLIDAAIHALTRGRESHDHDGVRARRGVVDREALGLLLADSYYAESAPKSTGREHFDAGYVRRMLASYKDLAPDDLIATLTELAARTVADALRPYDVARVFGSGGGMRNPVLVSRIAHHLGEVPLCSSEELDLPVDGKEAYLMGLLGYLTWHGIPAVPAGRGGRPLTGARRATVLGRLSPGRSALRLPEPAMAPTTMTVSASRDTI